MREYKPSKGFFDISARPKTLDKRTFEHLQEIQTELSHMQNNAEYYKKHHPQQWEKGKEMSAEIQQVIFRHWSHDELFGEAREHQLEMF
jgi:hypothetical protein